MHPAENKKYDFTDRRVFARLPARMPLRFLAGAEEITAQTSNISGSGLGLISQRRLSPNTALTISLEMPKHLKPIYIKGTVMWSRSLGLNCRRWRCGVYLKKVNLIDLAQFYLQYRKSNCLLHKASKAIKSLSPGHPFTKKG